MKSFCTLLSIFLAISFIRADPVVQTWRDPDNPYEWKYYDGIP